MKLADWVDKANVEILMEDGCTRDEAIRHLNNGSDVVLVEDWDAYIDQYTDIDKEYYSIMNISAGKTNDVRLVECNNKQYIIVYAL